MRKIGVGNYLYILVMLSNIPICYFHFRTYFGIYNFKINFSDALTENMEILVIAFLIPCTFHLVAIVWHIIFNKRKFLVLSQKQYYVLGCAQWAITVICVFVASYGLQKQMIAIFAIIVDTMILLKGRKSSIITRKSSNT